MLRRHSRWLPFALVAGVVGLAGVSSCKPPRGHAAPSAGYGIHASDGGSSPDAQACAAHGWTCGGTTYKDAAGRAQVVYCGACGSGEFCEPSDLARPGVGRCAPGNPVTPLQHQKFDMLVAMGENDTFAPAYAYAEDIGDGRGYTCGKVGFCTGSGDAILVARCYEDARPNNALSPYWPGLASINDAFFATGANQASTKDIDKLAPRGHRFGNADPSKRTGGDWAAAAQDPAFAACQDSMADALYLSLAVHRAKALHLGAPLTIGFLYDTELNFGEEDEGGNPGTATLIKQSLSDYQATYGKPFSSQPTPTEEQMLLGCFIFERTYDMAKNSTWKKATDQDATWEAARRTGNMDMSRPIASQYHASYGKGACWASLPSNIDSKYTVYTVESDPGDGSRAKGTRNVHQEKVACPPDPFAKCHR